LQRYVDVVPRSVEASFLRAAREAEKVLVTTRFTEQDALQYAGIPRDRVVRVPMLAPVFAPRESSERFSQAGYFLWTTNAAPHKNHVAALEALVRYYDEHEGELDCVVTGVGTSAIPKGGAPHLSMIPDLISSHRCLRKHVRWKGEVSEDVYRRALADAAFLWHAGRIDNGTFSVIEAAHLGVPALSSDYPAMREIDDQYSLQMAWMDPDSPADMARQLATMSKEYPLRKRLLPSSEMLAGQSPEALAPAYWEAIRSCL
jgi:glycosyltransferase involved in cell wall biosynthesis